MFRNYQYCETEWLHQPGDNNDARCISEHNKGHFDQVPICKILHAFQVSSESLASSFNFAILGWLQCSTALAKKGSSLEKMPSLGGSDHDY